MAPDKIYVHVRKEPRPSITFSEALEKNSSNVEYLRKDALLEWAKVRKSGLSSGESFVAGERKMLKEIIDKLNSM